MYVNASVLYQLPQQGTEQPAPAVAGLLALALDVVHDRLEKLPCDESWIYAVADKTSALAAHDALKKRKQPLAKAKRAAGAAAEQAVSPGPGPITSAIHRCY